MGGSGVDMDPERLASLVSVLSEFAGTVLTEFSLQAILDHLVHKVVELLPVSAAGVTLISSELLPHHVAASDAAALRFEQLQTELAQGPCIAAYESGSLVAVPDLAHTRDFPEFSAGAVELGLAAVFALPLRHAGGCLGALDLYRSTAGPLSPEDLVVAQTLADVTTSYLLNQRTREQALQTAEQFRDSALHDALTGLPNRLLFEERLDHAASRALRAGRITAVLFVDLDGFKTINDTYGHAVGDEVLVAVAGRLAALVRPGDTLARISGDEFVFLCEELTHPTDVELLTARIESAFTAPLGLQALALTVTASVGAAFAGPGQAITRRLLLDADAAMYQAKRRAAAHLVVDLTTVDSARARHTLQNDLRAALSRAELEVVYQPIVNLPGHSLCGVEALLRWPMLKRGPDWVGRARDIAEQNGFLFDVGAFALERACADLAAQTAAHPDRALAVSVNVSGVQLVAHGFVAMIASVLESTGLDPAALVLELGERIFLQEAQRALGVLAEIKTFGVRLALDSFGRDHGSLNQLRRLPVDLVKLDRGLVAELQQDGAAAVTVSSVVRLARELGLRVVAEGVATAEQHRLVSELGCDLGQGEFYGAPLGGLGLARLVATTS